MKIYDCFMYYDEDQLLDLRLNILNNYVDKFIIVESKFTHSGKIKNRNFQIDKFKKFNDKIEYIYIEEEPKNLKIIDGKNSEKEINNKNIYNGLLRDNFQRNCLNNCIQKLEDDDIIILSDLDEIPNLEKVNFEKIDENIYAFEQKMFYYKLNFLYPKLLWYGTKLCKKRKFVSPQWLRNIKSKVYPIWRIDTLFSKKKYQNLKIIKNGGWHFTNMKNPKQLHIKMSNFAHHPEYDQTKYSEKDMKNFIDKKIVFYDHFSDKNKNRFKNVNKLVKVDKNFLPEYLSNNLLKYQNLIE